MKKVKFRDVCQAWLLFRDCSLEINLQKICVPLINLWALLAVHIVVK